MKLSESMCNFTLLLIVAGLLNQAKVADGDYAFRRCYNTSVEMHCFDAQYDTTKNNWLTASFDNARKRCNDLQSTLVIIKDEETNNIVNNYISDPYSPIRFQNIWTDAYRISDFNNTHTWHWLNSTLPNMQDLEFSQSEGNSWYVESLAFNGQNGRFSLRSQQPHFQNSYVCEYPASKCPSSGSNVLQFADRCYISVRDFVSWYEARNKCLRDGGDLASFENVTSINFTSSWFGSDSNVRFWIGLRFTWYIWKYSGLDVKFAKWILDNDWDALCMVVCYYCNPNFSWLPKRCDNTDSTYVVCHSVTPLQAPTTTTTRATTLQVTTTASITTQTGNTQSNNPESNSPRSEKSTESSPIALAVGVGVGVGVGVPVIVAIIVIVICVVRRHQSKTSETSTTRQREEAYPTEVQAGKSDVSEISHYATIRSLSPPSAVEKESTPETQYETLGFKETADLKNGNGQSPLNVL